MSISISAHPSFQPMTRAHQAMQEATKRGQLSKRPKSYILRDKLGNGEYGSVYLAETFIKGKSLRDWDLSESIL